VPIVPVFFTEAIVLEAFALLQTSRRHRAVRSSKWQRRRLPRLLRNVVFDARSLPVVSYYGGAVYDLKVPAAERLNARNQLHRHGLLIAAELSAATHFWFHILGSERAIRELLDASPRWLEEARPSEELYAPEAEDD
jgi:hypothetical protein